MREELICDYKQFSQITEEHDRIDGKTSTLSQTMKKKAALVLRSRITPERVRDSSPSDPVRSNSFRSDGKSPIDLYV